MAVSIKISLLACDIMFMSMYQFFGGAFCLHCHSSNLKIEAAHLSKNSVPIYQTTRHHTPEDHNHMVC